MNTFYEVIDNKDYKIWRNLTPRDNDLLEVDLVLGHKMRVHKRDEKYRCPHQRVEHILAYSPISYS